LALQDPQNVEITSKFANVVVAATELKRAFVAAYGSRGDAMGIQPDSSEQKSRVGEPWSSTTMRAIAAG
jgi:hypothetical protein